MKKLNFILMALSLNVLGMQAQDNDVVESIVEEVNVNPAFYQALEDAQKKGITILAFSGIWTAYPEATIDSKTKKKVVVWEDPENIRK